MSVKNQNIANPTFDEVIAASKPGVSVDVRASLKKRLQGSISDDEALQGAVKFLADNNYDFDALHQFLDMPANLSGKKASASINYSYVLAVAASIMLIMGSIWFVFYRNNTQRQMSNAAFYEPGLPVFASIEGEKDFHELMSAYRMRDPKTGLTYYHKLIKKEPLNDTLQYFGGWLFFIANRPDSAITHFELVAKSNKGIYCFKAQYMEAISLYLNKQKPLSKQIFEKIEGDKLNPYQKEAMGLLAEPKLW